MISPEIWNFNSPSSSFKHQWCNSEGEIYHNIKNQLCHHKVEITMPNSLQIPSQLIETLVGDSQFYRINEVPIREIFNKNFINIFVKNGQLTACSINTLSDRNDSFIFIPNGKLVLNLSKASHQEIGLVSLYKNYKDSSRIVILDANLILEQNIQKINEIEEKFKNIKLYFDIIVAWEASEPDICPSTIAHYFSKKNYFVKTCNIDIKQKLSYNISVPIFDELFDSFENIECLLEWLGAFNLQCKLSDDKYISTFNCLSTCETVGQVCHINCTGFFSTSRLKKLVSQLIKTINDKPSKSWISLIVHGFENSLISSKNEKYFQTSSQHHLSIIFKSGLPTLVSIFSSE